MINIGKRNCPNCAAPYDIQLNKCPYCGTSYFDLSSLDLTNKEPFYLKIKASIEGKDCYITQLVRPNCEMEIVVERNDIYATGGLGNAKLVAFQAAPSLKTKLSFEATKMVKEDFMIVEIEE